MTEEIPLSQDRRVIDALWKDEISRVIKNLTDNQNSMQETLNKNNEMTESLLGIFNGTKAFWVFCTRASKLITTFVKWGTIIATGIIAFYHAVDIIIHNDLPAMFKGIFRK